MRCCYEIVRAISSCRADRKILDAGTRHLLVVVAGKVPHIDLPTLT